MQTVVVKPYDYLGGQEGIGSKGGYHNYEVHFPELWKFECVQRWLRKKQPNTRAEYLKGFNKFLLWSARTIAVRTPEEFVAWARRQPDGIAVQDLIDQYAEGLSKPGAHIATALLRSFLGRNACCQLPKIDWDSTVSFTEGFKREQLQTLLSYLSSPVHKFYVFAGKDSGLRANDLLYLRYKHIQRDFEAGQKFVAIEFEKERYLRRKAPGRTFLGPNSLDLLRQLIRDGLVKQHPEAKLFNFSYRNIANVLDHAKRTAGIDPKIQPSHGLRKFFENQLDRVGMDKDKKLQLEGHSSGVRNAYTSRDIDGLRALYSQAYSYLDLGEQAAASTEFRELKQTVVEQEKHIESLKAEITKKDRDLLELRGSTVSKADFEKQMNEMRELMFRELGIHIGKKIGQSAAAKKEEPSN